ncbi:hypothetical protein CH063_13173, partial [Colletotrichum higginsianum]
PVVHLPRVSILVALGLSRTPCDSVKTSPIRRTLDDDPIPQDHRRTLKEGGHHKMHPQGPLRIHREPHRQAKLDDPIANPLGRAKKARKLKRERERGTYVRIPLFQAAMPQPTTLHSFSYLPQLFPHLGPSTIYLVVINLRRRSVALSASLPQTGSSRICVTLCYALHPSSCLVYRVLRSV